MNFTDEQFEALKTRYIQKLRFSKQTFLNNARNQDTAQKFFGVGFQLTSDLELDEFSQKVSDSFIWLYEIGRPIDQLLDLLINDLRVKYLDEVSKRPAYKTVKVFKRFLGVSLPVVKYYETYNHNGELTERFTIQKDLNKENVSHWLEAKTKQAKKFIFVNLILKKNYLYQKSGVFTNQIIEPEQTDRHKWFKALIKYRAKREFMPELYASQLEPEQQTVVTQIREKRKTEVFKAVKWTDGRIKNNFPKLIYALHRAGYLENGNGEITKIVEQLAPAFGLELGDWESNLSKHIGKTKNGHDYEAFFEELKRSFREIVEQRRDDGDSKPKAKLLN